MRKPKTVLLIFSLLLILPIGCKPVDIIQMGVVESFDGVPISYSQYGKGDVTLVFIHGSFRLLCVNDKVDEVIRVDTIDTKLTPFGLLG